MQQQAGATKDIQFAKNSDTLRLVGNMWFEDVQGNCRKSTSIKQSVEDTKPPTEENEEEVLCFFLTLTYSFL